MLDLITIRIDLYDHPFIKYDIYESTVTLTSRGNPNVIIKYYCDHNNMTYVTQSNNNNPLDIDLPARKRANAWILCIVRKDPTTVQQVVEDVSSQQLTEKYNKFHVIPFQIDKLM